MPTPLPDDVRLALVQGKKLEAIQLLRSRTGLGLAEAREAVESGLVPDRPQRGDAVEDLTREVTEALAQGKPLDAIKLLRKAKGLSLEEAKAIADQATRSVPPPASRARSDLAPGEVPRSSFGMAATVLLISAAAGVAWFWFHQG